MIFPPAIVFFYVFYICKCMVHIDNKYKALYYSINLDKNIIMTDEQVRSLSDPKKNIKRRSDICNSSRSYVVTRAGGRCPANT